MTAPHETAVLPSTHHKKPHRMSMILLIVKQCLISHITSETTTVSQVLVITSIEKEMIRLLVISPPKNDDPRSSYPVDSP